MKKSVFSVIFIIFTVSLFAQLEYYHPSQNKPVNTQAELNQSLNRAKAVKGTGTVIALSGTGLLIASCIKAVQMDDEYGSQEVPQEENAKWASMVAGGCALTAAGLGVRIGGKIKEKKIKAELVKFQGSASGYSVGLDIRF